MEMPQSTQFPILMGLEPVEKLMIWQVIPVRYGDGASFQLFSSIAMGPILVRKRYRDTPEI